LLILTLIDPKLAYSNLSLIGREGRSRTSL
jgi:hypothetical protein